MPAMRSPGATRRSASAPGQGLFGPGSVTWQVMGQPVMWVAGLRAMYLQALHPRTMRATWQNSAFARTGEAWGRFSRTIEFVRVRTYGTMAEVDRAGRRVRKIHASLTGTDADGSVIRLDEPELLLWVHCGEVASYADVARRCGMRLSAAALDEFVNEQRRAAAVVGLDPADVPASMAELDAYYERMRPELCACDEARRALAKSYVPDIPWPFTGLRLVVPPLNTLAFASLPRWARRMYGAPGSPVTDLSTTVSLRALHQATTHIPRQLLGMPATGRHVGPAADELAGTAGRAQAA
ncbi:MAG TPA: oxygenase MpaB family protein [Streptosporangiaceae bacterium]|nr:oxygenase MpaB family protein [Streptosporangiaceae bacterium]